MRLEKLEVYGFKSFADKTDFIFQPGLTAFVGPNGCGKSNVVDAVKWVLGEQSVKSLRGNDMQDVIFNGTPGRRSAGYAEASLTLANTKGLLPTDYENVTVTRRLYRSGESEYFINKQRCRLRDIRDLFMDTGLGLDAYSMIEQGKVDALLTSNKVERRAIFEEAAGISKYRAQKKVCESKLDRVDNNLLRLNDIIDEVEKRMRSVKYQAAKARRWRKFEEEKRELSIALALHQYDDLLKERQKTTAELDQLTGEVGGLNAAVERMEAELSELETAVIDADQTIASLQAEDARIAGQLQAADEALRMNERRITELDELETRTKDEIAKTDASLDLTRNELTQAGTESAELQAALAAGQTELDTRRAALREIEQRLRGFRSQIDDKRSQALELAREHARLNNELSAIAAQRDQIVRQDERLAQRTAERRTQLAECSTQNQALAAKAGEGATRLATLEQDRTAADQQREALARTLAELGDRINQKRSEISAARSRHEMLQDLENKLEGVSAGVRHLLAACEGDAPELTGICGVIADVVEVDIQHAPAIEAALGHHEQLVVTESFDAMTRAIDFLARAGKGKAHFLPLDTLDDAQPSAVGGAGIPACSPASDLSDLSDVSDPSDLSATSTSLHPDILARAADVVRHPDHFRKAMHALLGDVVIVQDIESAKRLAASNEHATHGQDARATSRFRYATLDGQLLAPHGVSVGGSAAAAPGVISRRSELRSLEAQRAILDADLALLEQQRDEATRQAAEARARSQQLGSQIGAAQSELASARTELGKLDGLIKRLESEIETGESERSEIRSHVEILTRRECELREDAARIDRAESDLRATLAEQETLLKTADSERDAAQTESTRLEITQAQRAEQAQSLARRRDELARQIADKEKNLEAAREQVAQCGRRRTEAYETILAKKGEIAGLLDLRGKLGAQKSEAANRRQLIHSQFDSRREERSAASRRAKDAEAQLNKLSVHASEIAMHIENLERRATTEHSCSLGERHAAALRPNEGRAVTGSSGASGDVPVTASQQLDWNQIAAEIELIDQKMRSMGDVNTYAIQELEELESRATQLTSQREDLLKAEATLKDIIRKINKRSRELFEKTFNDVRENFQGLFRKLFGGGRADILLEPDIDILDAGIEIVACPPGKEPSSISLLSGGEKAMTAIALLFAVFRSKPSPFCLLDEVDAPLDENNIERFTMLVREFLKDSQFLVVTHNRRTMAMADVLYGITMQEPGISTKVSVKFADDKADVAAAG